MARPELADSLAERFNKFKARYRELYRAAHRQRRTEIERFCRKLELQQLRFAVLDRLNQVRELGNPIGTELEGYLKMLTPKLMPCPESLEPGLAASARCPACEFGFEDGPPLVEIEELEERLMAALSVKFQALSLPSVIRILTESDARNRLGGLLQLLRAGAIDELAAALDEDIRELHSKPAQQGQVRGVNPNRRANLQKLARRSEYSDEVGQAVAAQPSASLRKVS